MKPALLTVDDDPEVLRAVERDLRNKYAEKFRVLRANSGAAALDLLGKLKLRNEETALILADYRMPHMDGIEFLSQARKIYPDARRVLLTAYADTSAAIRAINDVHLDHYLLKPWDPPERGLYPVLDDLLEMWQDSYHPAFEGLRVLGTRWAPKSYEIRDFLARNQVPYQWLELDGALEGSEAAKVLASVKKTLGDDKPALPVAVLQDGTVVVDANGPLVAERIGLRTRATAKFYEMIVVGAGPAGLAASVYATSEGLSTLMVEKEAPGGQAGLSSRIENYLGFPSGLSGGELARRAVIQATRFGAEILAPQEVQSIRAEGPYRYVQLANGTEVACHVVMIATGVQWRKLDVPGMDRLAGAGVYYGSASTEAMSCKDEVVYVVGGANSAGQAAMNFSRYASKVIMLVRGEGLAATMSQYLIEQIKQTPNVEVYTRCRVTEVVGEDHLSEITIACDSTGTLETVPASSLFIFIGAEPKTAWLGTTVQRDDRGFVLTGATFLRNGIRPKDWPLEREPTIFETNVPGVYAVGDVRQGSVKRVASGVGEGSIAVQFVHQYLATL